MAKIVRLTEQDLVNLVKKVIKEGEKTSGPDPKRVQYFNNLAKEISKTLIGKNLFFGKIGVLDKSGVTFVKYKDRNHAINLAYSPVTEFNLYFVVRRDREDLNPGEKYGDRPWYGLLSIDAKYSNNQLIGNPDVTLYSSTPQGENVDFSSGMKPKVPWTWNMVGGSQLWSKAVDRPN